MTTERVPASIRDHVLACVEEEPGSTQGDVRALLLERGLKVDAAVVATALGRLTAAALLLRQSMPTGGRPIYCYRLPPESR
jgi:predicted transcriptional regulator